MPKFKIRENFSNGASQNTYIPASDEVVALEIAQALYGGELEVLKVPIDIAVQEPALTAVSYKDVSIMIRNEATDNKAYLNILVDYSKNTTDIISAIKDKTINGVKADTVTIISIRAYEV
jgi:hypothetical protein